MKITAIDYLNSVIMMRCLNKALFESLREGGHISKETGLLCLGKIVWVDREGNVVIGKRDE